MRPAIVAAALILTVVASVAQQESPAYQALSERFVQELRVSLQCSTELLVAKARIAELEKKLAEKAP